MSKLAGVRVIEIPKFRAVSSGIDTFWNIFGEKSKFIKWMDSVKERKIFKNSIYGHAYDFFWHVDNNMEKTIWIWAIEDWVTEADTTPYEIIEFEGGTYVVATTDMNDQADLNEVIGSITKWIEDSGVYEVHKRNGHDGMCHMIGGGLDKTLGIDQYEIFMLVRIKSKST